MRRRLIIGTIPVDFNPRNDIPIGPWCFLGREQIYPDWELLPFESDPFPTAESLQEASQKTCKLANDLVPSLASQLNQENGVCFSNRFWRLMLLPWLITLVQTTWFNLNCVERFTNKYRDEDIEVELITNSFEWNFRDTLDFIYRGILNPVFEHWLYSKIIESIYPDIWSKTYTEKKIEYNEIIKRNNISRKRLIYDKLFQNVRCQGVYGIGPVSSLLWSLFLSMKPRKFEKAEQSDVCESTDIDTEWPFDISSIIQKTMPLCFRNLTLIACKPKKYSPGKCRLIGPLLYYNEEKKYRLGLAVESGEKLICTQHGGTYGIAKVFSFATEVEYSQYRFFSWGWIRQEDYCGNIRAVSSPLLSKLMNKHSQVTSSLILVGTVAHLLMLRLDSVPQPVQNLDYRNNKIQFLQGLNDVVFRNVLYRPFLNEHGALKDRTYIKRKFPGLHQYCEVNLHPAILECKLLVLDNASTTLNIALAANIPTIGFWDKKAWSMCRQAIPYFEALEEAGIIFETGQDAAIKVNEIWDNVQGWWNENHVQKVRENWCDKYALTSKFWWWEWAKALWKM